MTATTVGQPADFRYFFRIEISPKLFFSENLKLVFVQQRFFRQSLIRKKTSKKFDKICYNFTNFIIFTVSFETFDSPASVPTSTVTDVVLLCKILPFLFRSSLVLDPVLRTLTPRRFGPFDVRIAGADQKSGPEAVALSVADAVNSAQTRRSVSRWRTSAFPGRNA